jgi:hypothetical protein
MEKIAKRNRDFLDSTFPGLHHFTDTHNTDDSFTYVTEPVPNIRVRGRFVHSKHNPHREALHLVQDIPVRQGIVLLFLGLGMGYQVERLKERFAGKGIHATFIVVERSTEIFTLLCHNRDLSFLENTRLFIGDSLDHIRTAVQEIGAFSFTGYRVVRLRGSHLLHREYYDRVEALFKEAMAGKLSDLLTRYAFETLWMRNTIDNIPTLVGKGSISSLKGSLRGRPALVLGAGPSLLDQLHLIGSIQNRIHLIAVDTVLTPLLRMGIEPDFVVTLDAGFHNSLDFSYLFSGSSPHSRMKLVADVVTNPLILGHWKGPLYFSETTLSVPGMPGYSRPVMTILNLLRDSFPHLGSLVCGGSITTTALELALFMDAEQVYVTGLDLSYTDYKSHVNSSPQYDAMYMLSNRFSSIQQAMLRTISVRRLTHLPAIHGGMTVSDYVFSQYVNWIQNRRTYRNNLINCTAQGVKLKGIPHAHMKSLLQGSRLPQCKSPVTVDEGTVLTPYQAQSFLEIILSMVHETQAMVKNEQLLEVLQKTEHVFHTIVSEAEKVYRDSESLAKYTSLFLAFLQRHIQRANCRIEKSYSPPV